MRMSRFTAVPFFALLAGSVCFGQMKGMGGGAMGMHENKMMDSSMGCMMATHMMVPQSIAATGDGGFVVLSGMRLLKYDKDLNFIKEVEVKRDSSEMHKMMMHMSKEPMMKREQKVLPADTISKNKK